MIVCDLCLVKDDILRLVVVEYSMFSTVSLDEVDRVLHRFLGEDRISGCCEDQDVV